MTSIQRPLKKATRCKIGTRRKLTPGTYINQNCKKDRHFWVTSGFPLTRNISLWVFRPLFFLPSDCTVFLLLYFSLPPPGVIQKWPANHPFLSVKIKIKLCAEWLKSTGMIPGISPPQEITHKEGDFSHTKFWINILEGGGVKRFWIYKTELPRTLFIDNFLVFVPCSGARSH